MIIDRSRFLVLVGTLAAASAAAMSACTVTSTPATTSGTGGTTTVSTVAVTTGVGGGTVGTTTGTGGAGGAGGGVTEGTGGGSCLGTTAVNPIPSCTTECGGVDACSTLQGQMIEGVREQAVACLNALDPNTCTMSDQLDCITASLSSACSDPNSDTVCAQFQSADSCGAAIPNCDAYVDGLTSAAQSTVTGCMLSAMGCTEDALGTCVASLFFP